MFWLLNHIFSNILALGKNVEMATQTKTFQKQDQQVHKVENQHRKKNVVFAVACSVL